MAADDMAPHPAHRWTPDVSVPEQSRRRVLLPPGDRLARQVQGIDAWIAARREREQALNAPSRLTREERLDIARQVDVLRRTHDAIKGRCALAQENDVQPMRSPGPTAVIAHRHVWFLDKLAKLLAERGVTVLVCTDNGAEALGAVIAEQPDLLFVSDPLAMLPGHVLMAETRLFAPGTLLAVQAPDQHHADALQAAADTVFLRHHAPGVVAEALVALHLTGMSQPSRV